MWKRHIRKIMALFLDEIDFMSTYCYEVVASIAIERSDISITASSTPLGKRTHFYSMCMNKAWNYNEHFHPSTHNPGWNAEMEAELRAQLTAEGYVHEVLAEFGTQEKGVFNKDQIDKAGKILDYAYNELSFFQKQKLAEQGGRTPDMYNYSRGNPAPRNAFRTMGIDWDKFGASSSLLILEYDIQLNKFKVLKRVEVPRSEYSYDAAVNLIVELNDIYNPSFIYCDAGAGEYQIERLHIIGDENPHTGLKSKVKRISFSSKLDIMDPVTKEMDKKPIKPFMINQLQIAFERARLILSPYDDILLKQLIDYEVEKITDSGIPKYTSENEHFVDALGLAYLAMVLEFKQLTGVVEDIKTSNKVAVIKNKTLGSSEAQMESSTRTMIDPRVSEFYKNTDFSDRGSDRQQWVKVDQDYRSHRTSGFNSGWGSRSIAGTRSGGFRRSW